MYFKNPYSESSKLKCAHPAWIEIDTGQFRKNLRQIRKMIGSRLFCLPLKANAYGHGLVVIAKIAEEEGIDYLGVSCLKEGAELRFSGIKIRVVILGAIHEEQIGDLVRYNLEFSISSKYKAELVAKKCSELGQRCKVHIEVDTGMRRTGVRGENALDLLAFVESFGCFDIVGIYSHMATSDVPNDSFALQQIAAFRAITQKLGRRKIICHLANSGGVIHYPESYFDMVRPGLLCYGSVMSLKANVSYFKVVQKGDGISYGHLYRAKEETRIVTIPVGYGDGYRRSLQSGEVLIRGKRFPIAGAICMDQFMVDIGQGEAYVGDIAVLIGKQGDEEITLDDLAKRAGTISHEMLTAFNDRLPRTYL